MLKRLLAPLLVLVCSSAAGVMAHVRLINPSNGAPLFWSNPAGIGIVINSLGSDNIADDSDEVALRMAIQEWNAVTGSSVRLVEDVSASQQARTDWNSTSIHLLLFDEVNSSGYFPFGSGTVAITPIIFFGNGLIADADVLFNGSGFNFTTSQQAGRFDVGDVAAHELGHLIGFDHSAQAGSTLYPYVDPSVILHRSISQDDVTGMRALAPSIAYGRITGTIRRASDNSVVQGAHVVARDSTGRTSASVLTTALGNFTLSGLVPESYQVYAVPLGAGGLDAPVTAGNLGAGFTIETDFQTTLYPSSILISGTETDSAGTLLVGPDIGLNLGSSFERYPLRVTIGQSTTILLRGIALNPPATLVASDPDFLIGTPMFFGSQVSFQVTVPAGEALGNVDLMITNILGQKSILPGALEVTPPSPTVASVSPPVGSMGGGTLVTLTGTNFNNGTRVVIGDQIYTDGIDGTTVLSPTSLQLTTNPTSAGAKDVVVIDATGVEGRRLNAFSFANVPVITTVFPAAGSWAGGTQVTLTGADFISGIQVRINGVDQGTLTLESSSILHFTSTAGSLGPQLLEVEDMGGMIASSSFTYATPSDPVLSSISPAVVGMAAGSALTLSGSGFVTNCSVWLGVEPNTGSGGVLVTDVTVVDSSTIEIVTPELTTPGSMSVMVLDGSTSQMALLSSGLSVLAPEGSGGGGGCYMVPTQGGSGLREVLLGSWWLAAVLGVLLLRMQRAQGRALVRGV